MAGLGRRTHYRKHVTDSVLNDLPEPGENESVAIIMATRGSNQFDVRLQGETKSQLAILPTKFRKLVWLKRNDFVIVQTSDDTDDPGENDKGENPPSKNLLDENEKGPTEETGSIRCMITHILYSDQIKHLRSKGLWPTEDPAFDAAIGATETAKASEGETTDDGIVYDTGYGIDSENEDDDDLFVNTNRVSRIAIQDDSSSSEEED